MRSDIEEDIETYFKKQVAKSGGLTEKHVCPGVVGPPDQIVTWRSARGTYSHRVELKAPGGKLKPWQRRYHEMLRDYGVEVFVLNTRREVDCYIATCALL